MPQVNLTLVLDIEGRPLWKMSLPVRPETTLPMGDAEYLKAVEAAGYELARQIAVFKKRKALEEEQAAREAAAKKKAEEAAAPAPVSGPEAPLASGPSVQ